MTSAVKAAAAKKRPLGETAAMWFFNWFVSTCPKFLPVFPCQSIISVPGGRHLCHSHSRRRQTRRNQVVGAKEIQTFGTRGNDRTSISSTIGCSGSREGKDRSLVMDMMALPFDGRKRKLGLVFLLRFFTVHVER